MLTESRISVLFAFMSIVSLTVAGCDRDNNNDAGAASGLAGDATISDAVVVGQEMIDDTVDRFFADHETWSSGLGEIPCTTGEEGLFEYDYARTLEVSDPAVRTQLMDDVWAFWQDHYGLEAGEDFSQPPDLVAFGEGFTLSMFGSARPEMIEVAFHTEWCLSRG